MARFVDQLNRTAEEIKAPPLPPVGRYLFMVKKHPTVEEFTSKKGDLFDSIIFECAIAAPIEVDADDLAAYGRIEGYTLRRRFLYNTNAEEITAQERTLNEIKKFLLVLGCFEEGQSLQMGLAGAANCSFQGDLIHRPNPENPEQFFAELNSVYSA